MRLYRFLGRRIFDDESVLDHLSKIATIATAFVLCAEEYYWFGKGFIEFEVWNCWLSAMRRWHQDSVILRKIIEDERKQSTNYYRDDFLSLFTAEGRL